MGVETLIALTGWGIAALGFLTLCVLVQLRSVRFTRLAKSFIAASVLTALWCLVALVSFGTSFEMPFAALAMESVARAAWGFFVLTVALSTETTAPKGLYRWTVPPRLWWSVLALLCWVDIFLTAMVFVGHPAPPVWAFLERCLQTITSLLLIEQAFRTGSERDRWSLKHLCVGLGAVSAFELVLYADAMVFGRLDTNLFLARGFLYGGIVPLLAVSAARNPTWSLDLHVSRKVVFHSTVTLGAAFYLVALGLVAFLVNRSGWAWSTVVTVLVVSFGLIAMVLMLLSTTLRGRLRLFLAKNFYSYRFDHRVVWSRFTEGLSQGRDEVQDLQTNTLLAMARVSESPAAALFEVNREGGLSLRVTHNMHDLPNHLPGDNALVQEANARKDAFHLGPQLPVPSFGNPAAIMAVPLRQKEELQAVVLLSASPNNQQLDWELSELLATAGQQAAGYLHLARMTQELVVARQFESFNRMSAFVIHDLKNLIAQLALLLDNAKRHRDNPEFQADMIQTIDHVRGRMNTMLLQLSSGVRPVDPPKTVNLASAIKEALDGKPSLRTTPQVNLAADATRVLAHQPQLARVLGHLIQNASESLPPSGGTIEVCSTRLSHADMVELTVRDSGSGMTESFIRNRLFKPFETTKASGMGIGMYESASYVRDLGGEIAAHSVEGEGSTISLRLPAPALEGNAS